MRIGVLGPTRLTSSDGTALEIGPPKVRALLTLLAAEVGEPVSVDRLVEGLWGESPPPTSIKTLQGYVVKLRSLAPGLIVSERNAYRLVLDPSETDAGVFEELIRRARNSDSDVEAVALYDRALALWRGTPFIDVDHDESFGSRRARLEQGRLEAVEGRIQGLVAMGAHRQAASELADLVMVHPLRERLWEQYMTALYRSGRQADALRAYQDARRILADELGIEPGPVLKSVEERVLRQDPSLLGVPSEASSVDNPPPVAQPIQDPIESRRPVTALLADVVGSTELGEKLDPEDLKLVIGEAVSRMARVAEELGGIVVSMTGDGFLAMFGVPISHEDDSERAVRSGLKILEATTTYGDEVERAWGIRDFAVRVGIDTGSVAVGTVSTSKRVDYTAYGDAINTASRLQSQAKPGGMLVSDHTKRLTTRAFVWGDRSELTMKGKSERVMAWEVIRALPAGESRRSRRLRASLVGRSEDVKRWDAVAEALERGSGGMLFISGEPGIGKSRLLSELRSRLEERSSNVMWLQGHGVSYGESSPYGPFREVLRSWLEMGPDEPELKVRVALHRKLDEMLGERSIDYYPFLGALLGLDMEPEAADRLRLSPESLQYRTFEVVGHWLATLADAGPTVLAIDDLHWVDPTSLLLIEQLMGLTDEVALLVILAQRVERAHASWRLREEVTRRIPHRVRELRLESLGTDAEQQLLAELVGAGTLPRELEERLLSSAEGNPFYLEELVGSLIDAGSLVTAGNGWRFDHEVPINLPETVEAVVLARIDRLDPASHRVLTAASALGRTFGLPLLHEVVRQESTVVESIKELQRVDLVQETRRWPQAEYRFKHALIQEAAYRTIPSERRTLLHRAAADWLTSRRVDREESSALLAHHWLAAGEIDQAIPALQRAGDQARREHALDEAIEHYRLLLTVLENRGEKHSMALTLFKLGQALHSSLRFSEAIEAFERAFANWDPAPRSVRPRATLRMSGAQRASQPDPPRSYNLPDLQLQMSLFDRLVERSAADTIIPSLAESWEINDDGMVYRFHLRPGLCWSDGTPMTAADVEYGILRNLDPARPGVSMAIYFVLDGAQSYSLGHHTDPGLVGVKALDDRTVEFRMAAPAPFFFGVVNRPDGGPQPRHAIERYGDAWIDVEHQVVSGPFRRTEASPALTVLERRTDYQGWQTGNVQRVEIHHEPPSATGVAYRRGERDLVFGSAVFGTEEYGEIPEGETRMEPTAWLNYLILNHTDPAISDLRFRRGLAHAIDRHRLQLVAPVTLPPATGGVVPPALAGHTADIALRHDPTLARQLVAESGSGRQTLRFGLAKGIALSRLGYEVAAMWQQELELPVQLIEYVPGSARGYFETLKESQVMLDSWFPGYPDPEYFLRLLLHSDSSDNRGRFSHPPFDDLIEQARRERNGRVRLRLFHEADRLAVVEQVAMIPLAYGRNVTISKPWVKGWWEFGKSWSSFADLEVDEAGQAAAGSP